MFHFCNYLFCNFCPWNIKVFSIATVVFFNNSLPTYYNYNIIFLMCNIRELFRDFWSLNTHLLLDWSFWSLDLFERYLLVKVKGPKSHRCRHLMWSSRIIWSLLCNFSKSKILLVMLSYVYCNQTWSGSKQCLPTCTVPTYSVVNTFILPNK